MSKSGHPFVRPSVTCAPLDQQTWSTMQGPDPLPSEVQPKFVPL